MFNFETQLNFEDDEMMVEPQEKMNVMPTTAYNSPGSHKSAKSAKSLTESYGGISENYDLELRPDVDNSFEIGTQVNHASNIHEASVNLISNSVLDSSDNKLFSMTVEQTEESIDDAIKGNRLLRYYQKANFIAELQKENELSNLLSELLVLFNPKIFSEVVYIVHAIWTKKYLPYRESKNNKNRLYWRHYAGLFCRGISLPHLPRGSRSNPSRKATLSSPWWRRQRDPKPRCTWRKHQVSWPHRTRRARHRGHSSIGFLGKSRTQPCKI